MKDKFNNMFIRTLTYFAFICTLTVFSQISNSGLVAFYPFDNNANDYSGTGNNGISYNTSSTTNKNGLATTALAFNGSTSYINLGKDASLKMTEGLTISAWVYLNTVSTTYQNIISDHSSNQRTVGPGKILRMAGNKLQFIVSGIYGGSSPDPAPIYIETTLASGKWYHIVASYDKQAIKIYVNNSLAASLAYNQSLVPNPNDLLIGNSGFGGEYLNGKLDQFRIYNRAVTPNEITALYNENDFKITVKGDITTVCKGGNTVLYAPKGYTTYKWSNGVQNIDSLVVTEAGTYSVTANETITSNSINITQDLTTTNLSLEKFICIQASPMVLNGTPTPGTFYGNGVEDGKFVPQLAGLGTSVVYYNFTGSTGCKGVHSQKVIVYDTLTSTCSVKDTLYMEVITNIQNEEKSTIKIYPNPALTVLEINVGNSQFLKSYNLSIQNSLGQPVFDSSVNNEHFSIPVSSWIKGIYLLKLTNTLGDVIETRKIVIQ